MTCTTCNGRGYIQWHPHWDNGTDPCKACNGHGVRNPTVAESMATTKERYKETLAVLSKIDTNCCDKCSYWVNTEELDSEGFMFHKCVKCGNAWYR